MAFDRYVQRAFAAVAPVRFRYARDNRTQRRFRQPFGNAAAQHARAECSLAGDHQDRAAAFGMGPQYKLGKHGAGTILIQPMQIEAACQVFAFDLQSTPPARLDRLRRPHDMMLGLFDLCDRLGGAEDRGRARRRLFLLIDFQFLRNASTRKGAHGRRDRRPKPRVQMIEITRRLRHCSMGVSR